MEANKPKLLITGYRQHGKDTVADILGEYGFTKQDSSRKALEIFLFEKLAPKYGYKSLDEAYEDRVNHRSEWYEEIKAYNTPDKCRLARQIMAESDIYVGMRDKEEIIACKEEGIFDWIIWVDASKRKPPEDLSSCTVSQEDAHIILDNNRSEEQLNDSVACLWSLITDQRNCDDWTELRNIEVAV